ncbi:NAD-dependent epimerase [Actinospica sp. MGRD01-02]|uniref:NAD-dependent epimerase n=1 Tax=Actinospica acidithermotolerans TaxID=2828514 RepID=A0A941EAF2_9ACTN|nr:NAD-dependent epimerase [Actinospica acidithermotolerans]MBR7826878.1 NAD-dependent epimerase [Actinospica acidithermotolerans]
MRILIIGGGRFLGRAFAAEALAAGHQVTVFNRGRQSTELAGVRVVRGDREKPEDLARLAESAPEPADGGPGWDAVVDTCGYQPKIVGESARALRDKARAYLFISSLNAYPSWAGEPVRDGSPKYECGPDETEGEYGPLKAGCERAVLEHFPDRTICIDAGLILGPHETSGRLTWWLKRIARGGDVLAPGDPKLPIGPIDARDIALFGLRCIENGEYGAFPTVGPATETFGDLLEACVRETGSGARLRWAGDEFLRAHEIPEWTGLPAWSARDGAGAAVWDVRSELALEAGLRCRPLAETVRDTWAWLREVEGLEDGQGRINGHGIAPEVEAAALKDLVGEDGDLR